MFWCLPSDNKCEWKELRFFVDFFNDEFETNYNLISCLDVKDNRNPQPEIRLKNKDNTNEYMVIERKNVVFPEDRIKNHYHEHEFIETIIEELENVLDMDKLYKFQFVSPNDWSKKLTESRVKKVKKLILENINFIKKQKTIKSKTPFPWFFYEVNKNENQDYNRKSGIWVQWTENNNKVNEDYNKKLNKIKQILKKHLKSAEKKFEPYNDDLKILLLYFYINSYLYLDKETIKNMLNEINIPDNIEQIWLAEPKWISYKKQGIGYEKLI